MTFEEKIQAFKADMKVRDPDFRNPAVVTWLWRLGLKVPPMVFWGKWTVALFMAVCWGAAMLIPVSYFVPFPFALKMTAGVAIAVGTFISVFQHNYARRLHLPAWQDYPAGSRP